MKIIVGNAIIVSEPTADVIRFCKNNLVLTNPDYISRQRLGKWTGSVPKYLHLYEEHNGCFIIPYGCKEKIVNGSSVEWMPYPKMDDFRADYKSNIQLYDYQKDAADKMIKERHGVVVMPCGSGKTQTALECVAKLGLRTLWLTHTQDLLNQSMERAKNCFSCSKNMFGTITAGKVNISNGITFATVQTMCKLDLMQYRSKWAVVVVDECQHCCGSPTKVTQFYKVVNSLYAPYKFGLTATPERTDGLDESMFALLGDKIAEVTKEQVADKTCPVRVELVETGYEPDDIDAVLNSDGTLNYSALVSDLTSNAERFSFAVNVIKNRCSKGYSMVLANRVQYLKDLCYVCEHELGLRCVCLSSATTKAAKEERKEALKKLDCGEIDCIFATYQLAAEGLDCPNLRYIVFATPEKDKRTITQAVGRVARKAIGKEHGTVIDLVDNFSIYKSWGRMRGRYYLKLNCNVQNS